MSKKKPALPMLQAWNEYVENVYPHTELSAIQSSECQQAFYAGYIEALSNTIDLLDYPTDKAKEILRGRIDWLLKYQSDRNAALSGGEF